MGIAKSLTKEMIKEIGNKSREFYEFVLPPVDMYFDKDKLTLLIDLPGFTKNDIKLSLEGNILTIQACKDISDKKDHSIICNQRPNIIDKKIRLPVDIKDEEINSAKYENGVLTVMIPVKKHGKDISIE
ncbi:MAG: Hsp20/alpha crystallin family protein [Nitrosarchaeum sp.]|nr:Hsp20/alpha crystallin family protein [Nitrosarchaeum sp.]